MPTTRLQILSVAQRQLLRNLGGWMVADALIDPESGCARMRTSMWGGTYSHDGQNAYFDCGRRGIVVYTYRADDANIAAEDYSDTSALEQALGREDILLLRWTQLTRYAQAMPADDRQRLRAARAAVQKAWMALCGCAPAPGQAPAPRDPAEHDRLHRQHREATQRLTEQLHQVLPLDAQPEQLDLFEVPR